MSSGRRQRGFTYLAVLLAVAVIGVGLAATSELWSQSRQPEQEQELLFLGDLHMHDLRHTVGMRLREAGVREETIADILWHSGRGMTAHYSMAQIVEIRDALELITDERNCFNKSLASLIREKSPALVVLKQKAAVAHATTA